MQSGNFSILKTSEFHKTESVCSLSDILEDEVDERYFLSQQTIDRLISYKDSFLIPSLQEMEKTTQQESSLTIEGGVLKVNGFHKINANTVTARIEAQQVGTYPYDGGVLKVNSFKKPSVGV